MTMLDTQALRDEAAQEPDPVHTGEVTSETQVIAQCWMMMREV